MKTITQLHMQEQGFRGSENLNDELKDHVLANLKKNLSLEQLENLQEFVKKTHFHNKNYIEQ